MGLLTLIVLGVLLIGAAPTRSQSRDFGYGSSGGLGTLLVIVVSLALLVYLPGGD
jgi:hypothetical protein